MLEMRPTCEHCDKKLPNESGEAMICTYECTFCSNCVTNVLMNVCPNCGGGFEKRPTRPKGGLLESPISKKQVFNPVSNNLFLEKNIGIEPRER